VERYGSELCQADKDHVLAAYVYRFTGDHIPSWYAINRPDGKPYKLQFVDDLDWLNNTLFKTRIDGTLDMRTHRCMSFPTWPDGKD